MSDLFSNELFPKLRAALEFIKRRHDAEEVLVEDSDEG
jgi:hypothetical protein